MTFAPSGAPGGQSGSYDDFGGRIWQTMPTPMGHALGGLAAAFLADSAAGRHQLTPALLLASAAAAVAPDLDLLTGSHRTYTHSLAAVVIILALSWLALRRRLRHPFRVAAILAAAYASHLVLD